MRRFRWRPARHVLSAQDASKPAKGPGGVSPGPPHHRRLTICFSWSTLDPENFAKAVCLTPRIFPRELSRRTEAHEHFAGEAWRSQSRPVPWRPKPSPPGSRGALRPRLASASLFSWGWRGAILTRNDRTSSRLMARSCPFISRDSRLHLASMDWTRLQAMWVNVSPVIEQATAGYPPKIQVHELWSGRDPAQEID
jgi:hypothetical protein